MPTPLPPVEHRFTSAYAPRHTQKGPYLLPLLKRFLNKKINFEDPETQKIIKSRVKDAVIWRLILNATEGENDAIKEILNRIDGKNDQEKDDSSKEIVRVIVLNNVSDIQNRTQRQDGERVDLTEQAVASFGK